MLNLVCFALLVLPGGVTSHRARRRSGSTRHSRHATGENGTHTSRSGQPKRRTSNNGMMSRLALRFPLIRASFLAVYNAFTHYILERSIKITKYRGALIRPLELKVTASSLADILQHLVHKNFSDAETIELFALADLSGSHVIHFREFLIVVAMGYFLKQPLAELTPEEQEVARGFRVVAEAFEEMDSDHSGTVNAGELKNALFSTSASTFSTAVLEARLAELDFNHDGDIAFPEFLYGIVSWVGFDTNEDDPDDLTAGRGG